MIFGLIALAAMAFPGLAVAHVTVAPESVPAEGYAMLTFTVPHGCDGAATNRVQIKMPDEVVSATPGVVPGWKIKAVEGKLPKPAEQHGEKVTQGVRQVTWTGGPLAGDQLEQFPLSVALAGNEGEHVEFKVIQNCVDGSESAWIQSSADGEEPDHPAPAVDLVEAADSHGHSGDDPDTENASASASGSDDSGNGLAVAALIVGALGLLTGGTALVSGRRK